MHKADSIANYIIEIAHIHFIAGVVKAERTADR